MNRRKFVRAGTSLLALAGLPGIRHAPAFARAPVPRETSPRAEVWPARRARGGAFVRLPATLQPRAFEASSGDDARYHALVYEGGGAAGKALLTTSLPDVEVAEELRALGADDGGGVPMAAWTRRRLPLVRAPEHRVAGSPIALRVEWEGWEAPRHLSALLEDPGGRGVALRFGGNEEHDDRWDSGCIVCLFSCPGGVVSNASYSIRDHVRGATRFAPADDLPPDGTEVTVTLELLVELDR